MFALIHLISGTGTSKNKRVVLGNTLPAKKMAESEDMIDVCDDLGIESFFEHVLNRTEELLDENSNVSGEHRISTHFDLLERTVRLLAQLARIVTDETDLKLLGAGGLAFDLAAFRLSMIAPVKKSVNHPRTVASMCVTGWE